MSNQRRRPPRFLLVLVALAALVSACGKKGDPLPPLRYVPATIQDLSIHQQGNLLIFQMGYPQTTASGQVLPGISSVEILELRVGLPDPDRPPEIDPRMFASGAERLVALTGPELTAAIAGNRFEAKLPLATIPEAAELHAFGVRTVSESGEVSDTSNLVQLVLKQPAPPPSGFLTTPTADGVKLSWDRSSVAVVGYNIYRREATSRAFGRPLEKLPPDKVDFVDSAAAFGSSYIYSIRGILSAAPLIESSPATESEVDFKDRFAPEPPMRVVALGEGGQARLVWEDSPSDDAVAYKVYRRDSPEGDFRLVTEQPVQGLEYLDLGLASGIRFLYQLTSIDSAGNEGPPTESVPVVIE